MLGFHSNWFSFPHAFAFPGCDWEQKHPQITLLLQKTLAVWQAEKSQETSKSKRRCKETEICLNGFFKAHLPPYITTCSHDGGISSSQYQTTSIRANTTEEMQLFPECPCSHWAVVHLSAAMFLLLNRAPQFYIPLNYVLPKVTCLTKATSNWDIITKPQNIIFVEKSHWNRTHVLLFN